jgi:elongator complex protein 3
MGPCRLGFTSETLTNDLANRVTREAEERGIYCQCIRCSEVRNKNFNMDEIKYNVYQFKASGASEYYICAEVERPNRNLLIGFIRLRLCHWKQRSVIAALAEKDTAMIRELHVYGQVNVVGDSSENKKGAQHRGIGRQLLTMAEKIAAKAQYEQIAVISGIGVRDYYKKFGYELKDTYMIKALKSGKDIPECVIFIITVIMTLIVMLMLMKII